MYNYEDFQILRNKMVSCADCEEWFHISCLNVTESSSTEKWCYVNYLRNADQNTDLDFIV